MQKPNQALTINRVSYRIRSRPVSRSVGGKRSWSGWPQQGETARFKGECEEEMRRRRYEEEAPFLPKTNPNFLLKHKINPNAISSCWASSPYSQLKPTIPLCTPLSSIFALGLIPIFQPISLYLITPLRILLV